MNVDIPGRTWILIWLMVFGSIGVYLWLVFDGAMGNLEQRFYHLEVPGSMELPNLARGQYFIYHEFDKSRDSKEDIKPTGFGRLAFTITPVDGGAQVPIRPVDKVSRFVIRRNVCESVFEFNVPAAGGYRVNADYESGQAGGSYRVAIGQPYYLRAVRNFVLGLVLLVVAGVVVSWTLFSAMRKATALAAAAPPEEMPNA